MRVGYRCIRTPFKPNPNFENMRLCMFNHITYNKQYTGTTKARAGPLGTCPPPPPGHCPEAGHRRATCRGRWSSAAGRTRPPRASFEPSPSQHGTTLTGGRDHLFPPKKTGHLQTFSKTPRQKAARTPWLLCGASSPSVSRPPGPSPLRRPPETAPSSHVWGCQAPVAIRSSRPGPPRLGAPPLGVLKANHTRRKTNGPVGKA